MRPLSFVIIGSGFRAMFYGRIARRYPELFTLKYILCRSEEKAAKVHGETGFPTTVSDEDCKNSKPDFVVVAVNKGNIADVAEKWALMGYPVLTETPIGCSLKQLRRIWELKRNTIVNSGLRAVFSLSHTQGRTASDSNEAIGQPDSMYLSLVHEYHGASLIRKYLLMGHERFSVIGKQFTFPLTETDSRQGAITDGSVSSRGRIMALFEFASGKTALYIFRGNSTGLLYAAAM